MCVAIVKINNLLILICLTFFLLYFYSNNSEAQEWIFASSLPQCPRYEKISSWSDCVGAAKASNGFEFYGEWKGGKQHGQASKRFSDGSKYEGEWKEGFRDGYGIFTDVNGGKYMGEWKKNARNGKGKQVSKDGTTQEGVWENNIFVSNLKSNQLEPLSKVEKIQKPTGLTKNKQEMISSISSDKQNNQTAGVLNMMEEEKICIEIGFKRKTEAFGNCVLELHGRKGSQSIAANSSDPDDATCLKYGFKKGTNEFAQYKLQIDQAKQDTQRQQAQYAAQQKKI